jgi:hypothetical protein
LEPPIQYTYIDREMGDDRVPKLGQGSAVITGQIKSHLHQE